MSVLIEIPNPSLTEIKLARNLVETHLAETKRVADHIRVQQARAELNAVFLQRSTAVFIRNWETDEYYLGQLTAAQPGVQDLDIAEDGTHDLSDDQVRAIVNAQEAIQAIGVDNDIWAFLDAPEVQSDGWYEFILPLTSEESA